jgi:hypothetical protein
MVDTPESEPRVLEIRKRQLHLDGVHEDIGLGGRHAGGGHGCLLAGEFGWKAAGLPRGARAKSHPSRKAPPAVRPQDRPVRPLVSSITLAIDARTPTVASFPSNPDERVGAAPTSLRWADNSPRRRGPGLQRRLCRGGSLESKRVPILRTPAPTFFFRDAREPSIQRAVLIYHRHRRSGPPHGATSPHNRGRMGGDRNQLPRGSANRDQRRSEQRRRQSSVQALKRGEVVQRRPRPQRPLVLYTSSPAAVAQAPPARAASSRRPTPRASRAS